MRTEYSTHIAKTARARHSLKRARSPLRLQERGTSGWDEKFSAVIFFIFFLIIMFWQRFVEMSINLFLWTKHILGKPKLSWNFQKFVGF